VRSPPKKLKVKFVEENFSIFNKVTAEIPLPESEEAILLRPNHSRAKVIAIATGLVLLLGAGATGFWVTRTKGVDLSAYTVPVESEVLTLRITANGKIVPFQSVNLSPKTAGTLVKLLVEQGDRVSQGQLLARMDDSGLEGQLIQAKGALEQSQARINELKAGNRSEEKEQAKARLAQAEVNLLESQKNQPQQIKESENQVSNAMTQLKLADERYQRFKTLVDQGAATRDRLSEAERDYTSAVFTLDEAQRRLERAKIQTAAEIAQLKVAVYEAKQAYQLSLAGTRPEVIQQAEAEIQQALGQIVNIRNQLQDTEIRAPFDGIVTQKYATEGAFVTPTTSASSTSSATSTSIVALARGLEIIAEIPEVDIGKIKQNQVVDIRADAYPDQLFKGRVRLIAPEAIVEQNVTSFQVRVQVQTGQDQLRSGMNTDLTFLGETVRDALVVPTVAIATQKGQTGVYIPDGDNKPAFKPITIGSSIQDKTQVLEGLERDEKIFVDFPEGLEPEEPEN
jgi:HlyD family secretion protein